MCLVDKLARLRELPLRVQCLREHRRDERPEVPLAHHAERVVVTAQLGLRRRGVPGEQLHAA